jgi:glycosyltransferase involved in cell wall biosynthesis
VKILFLSDNFPPEVNAPASRTFEHCREWVRAGHEVTVITCAPNFPAGKLFAGYRNRWRSRETIDGIEVIRVWTYIAANTGVFTRIFDYLSFMFSATLAGLFVARPDIIVATSPQFFTAIAGRILGTLRRRPWVFELRDLWPESIAAVGAMRESVGLRLFRRIELHLYRHCRGVVAVTEGFKTHLISRGIAAEKIAVVTNGADLSRFAPRQKDAALVSEFGLEGKFVAGYVGTHGMAHGLETLLHAADLLRSRRDGDRYRLILLGDGARKTDLQRLAKERNLDNVLFLETVSKDEVPRYWSLLDASIIHLRPNDLFKSVIPSKLFECMAMGVPVLHGVQGESAEIVSSERVGEVFPSGDSEALAEHISALAADKPRLDAMREAAIAAAPRYDRAQLARRMEKQLAQWAM